MICVAHQEELLDEPRRLVRGPRRLPVPVDGLHAEQHACMSELRRTMRARRSASMHSPHASRRDSPHASRGCGRGSESVRSCLAGGSAPPSPAATEQTSASAGKRSATAMRRPPCAGQPPLCKVYAKSPNRKAVGSASATCDPRTRRPLYNRRPLHNACTDARAKRLCARSAPALRGRSRRLHGALG